MPLDISRALRSPGDSFPFEHEELLPPQSVLGEEITFDPVRLKGQFSLSDSKLRLWGELNTTAHGHCAKCLEPAQYPIHTRFEELFRQDGDPAIQEDPLEDEGRMVFSGPKLDLSHLAMTLSLLELPLRFLCREDCAGLQNVTPLIDTHAGQKELPDEHPFSALQELLNKDLEV